jgi:hypothetical protein
MKTTLKGVMFFCIVLLDFCVTGGMGASDSAYPDYAERLSFQLPLDGRQWKVGYKAEDRAQVIFEYVLQGETVENWTELVTIQSFDKQYIKFPPPETAMNLLKERMVQRCPTVEWNVNERTKESILYEWRIKNCPPNPDQMEIARLIEGKWNRYRVAYATKVSELPQRKRTDWIKSLREAKTEVIDLKSVPR